MKNARSAVLRQRRRLILWCAVDMKDQHYHHATGIGRPDGQIPGTRTRAWKADGIGDEGNAAGHFEIGVEAAIFDDYPIDQIDVGSFDIGITKTEGSRAIVHPIELIGLIN